jgi:hypothetical protein
VSCDTLPSQQEVTLPRVSKPSSPTCCSEHGDPKQKPGKGGDYDLPDAPSPYDDLIYHPEPDVPWRTFASELEWRPDIGVAGELRLKRAVVEERRPISPRTGRPCSFAQAWLEWEQGTYGGGLWCYETEAEYAAMNRHVRVRASRERSKLVRFVASGVRRGVQRMARARGARPVGARPGGVPIPSPGGELPARAGRRHGPHRV